MRYILSFLFLACFCAVSGNAQERYFKGEVQNNTIEQGAVFQIDFIIKNLRGTFEAPDFSPFIVAGGPNQSSSIKIINGEYFQEYRYSYLLKAPDPGTYFIPEATLILESDLLQTEPIEILVVPEGEGKQENEQKNIQQDSLEKVDQILRRKKVKKF